MTSILSDLPDIDVETDFDQGMKGIYDAIYGDDRVANIVSRGKNGFDLHSALAC